MSHATPHEDDKKWSFLRFLRNPWVVGIVSGIILIILGGILTSLYHSWRESSELHNLGARYNVGGFTVSVNSITCK
jgi:hypothetical protein